jgi:DNA-binding GntR family transcriptional regulator
LTSRLRISGTNYQRVGDRLRADILSGSLAPGHRLKVVELAKRYGLSQMPIREAIQQLQGEGLVIVVPHRGASVRTLNGSFVSDILDIRIALESALTAQAAALISAPEIAKLETLLARYEANRSDREATLKINNQFHGAINAASGNSEASKLLVQHTRILHGLRRRFGYGPDREQRVIDEHRAILAALRDHDVETARQVSAEHIKGAKADLLALMAA